MLIDGTDTIHAIKRSLKLYEFICAEHNSSIETQYGQSLNKIFFLLILNDDPDAAKSERESEQLSIFGVTNESSSKVEFDCGRYGHQLQTSHQTFFYHREEGNPSSRISDVNTHIIPKITSSPTSHHETSHHHHLNPSNITNMINHHLNILQGHSCFPKLNLESTFPLLSPFLSYEEALIVWKKKNEREAAERETPAKPAKKEGWCECCLVKYEDLDQHVKTLKHVDYAMNDGNYAEIDAFIRDMNGET